MRTTAGALAWQIWRRNRLGLCCVLGGLPCLGLLLQVLPPETRMGIGGLLARMSLIPAFFYVMGIFTFADLQLTGRVRFERYPRRMFTLPARTRALVGWPMLYGGALLALLWVAAERLILRPTGVEAPVLGPALGLAATAGFFQALAWAPFASPLVRVLGGGLLVPAPLLLALRASLEPWSSVVMAPLFVLLLGLAYAGALVGVGRDRRGETLDLEAPVLEWLRRLRPRRLRGFSSAAAAQAWYEVRTKGPLLPLTSALMLILLCLPLRALRENSRGDLVLVVTLLMLSSPLWLCALLGSGLAKPRFWSSNLALPAFLATKPLTTGELYLALLKSAARSLLATWLLIGLGLPVLFWLAGNAPEALHLAERLAEGQSPGAMIGWSALGLAAAYSMGLGLLASGMTAGLAGRESLVIVDGLLRSLGIALLVVGGHWLREHPATLRLLLESLPYLALAALAGKGLLSVWALRSALERGILRRAEALRLLGLWLVGAACVAGFGVLALPASGLPVPAGSAVLCLLAVLPMARPALGPLALEWNRRR